MKSHRDKPNRPYEVEIPYAVGQILHNKFPGRLTDEVISFLQKELRFDPDEFGPYGRQLRGSVEKKYSARRRHFRVIYKIDEAENKITIVKIDPL